MWGHLDFIMFVSYAQQGCIYLIKNTVKTDIVKYDYNLKDYFLFQ